MIITQDQSKLPDNSTSIFAVMSGLAREHRAINLSQGFPGFDCDPVLKEWVHHFMKEGMNQYAPMPGVPELREGLSNKIQSLYGRYIDPAKEITITAGATQAIFCAIAALIHPGDEVIIIDPAYDSYAPSIKLQQAIPIAISVQAPDYLVDWDRVESAIGDKTRMIIVNNPHNPTGRTFQADDLNALQTLTSKYDLLILSDEVYEHIIFDGRKHLSVLESDALFSRSIATYSFGKVFHNTGWKTGYAVGPENLMAEFRKVHQFNVFSVSTPVQYALSEYLKQPEHYLGVPTLFEEKRDFFINAIQDSHLRPLKCEGTYFLLCDYSEISQASDMEFARNLTIDHGVATIPLSPFYQDPPNDKVVRICFAKENRELAKAAERIRRSY